MASAESMESLVEAATSDVRMGLVDFGVNLEICDALGRNSDDAPVMVAAVRKRLASKDKHAALKVEPAADGSVTWDFRATHDAVRYPTSAFKLVILKAAEVRFFSFFMIRI